MNSSISIFYDFEKVQNPDGTWTVKIYTTSAPKIGNRVLLPKSAKLQDEKVFKTEGEADNFITDMNNHLEKARQKSESR